MLGFCCCGEPPITVPCGCCQSGHTSLSLLVQIPAGWSTPGCENVAGSYVLTRLPHPTNPAICFWKYTFDDDEPPSWAPLHIEATLTCDFASVRLFISVTYLSGFVTWLKTYPAGTLVNCAFNNLEIPFEANSGFIVCQLLSGLPAVITAL